MEPPNTIWLGPTSLTMCEIKLRLFKQNNGDYKKTHKSIDMVG